MRHLFTPQGDQALRRVMALSPLLAFDFDGTLAPIVARPQDARISRAVASRLDRLARQLPVAIVTGRAVGDVRQRLGFEPTFVVGNHGAEGILPPDDAARFAAALDPLRDALRGQADALHAAGVVVEDKSLSIALHYRLAADRGLAQALLARLLSAHPQVHRFEGKLVVNLVPPGLPDKAHAVLALVTRAGADAAVFAGDDVNDEPVFAAAPANWLTLRIGRDDLHSRARFCLDSPREVALLLERMLELAADGRPA